MFANVAPAPPQTFDARRTLVAGANLSNVRPLGSYYLTSGLPWGLFSVSMCAHCGPEGGPM
eukprot:3134918-Pleurochrysis_carterae.AAC.1